MTDAAATDLKDGRVPCRKCGKRHKWREKLAGQKARCTCGAVVLMPQQQPEIALAEEEIPVLTEEIVEEVEIPAPSELLVEAPEELVPSDELELSQPEPMRRTLPPRSLIPTSSTSKVALALERREDEVQLSMFKEKYLPIALLCVGVVGNYVLWQFVGPGGLKSVGFATGMLVLQALVFVPVTVFAVVMVARVMSLGIGPIVPALFKIIAVTLGSGAIADVAFYAVVREMGTDVYALAGGFFIYIALCGFPMKVLFDLELGEMMAIIAIVVVPRLAIFFTIAATMPSVMGH